MLNLEFVAKRFGLADAFWMTIRLMRPSCSPVSGLQGPGHRGFTMVELLVVVVVLGILMGLALPVLSRALAKAKETKSLVNLRQLGMFAQYYAGDNNGATVPGKSGPSDMPSLQQWQVLLAPYASGSYTLSGGSGIWDVADTNGPKRKDFSVFWLERRFPESIVAKNRYWDTGYGVNMLPGLPDSNIPNTKEVFGTPYSLMVIAKTSQRILFAEWPFWNMYVNAGDLNSGLLKTYADAQGGKLRVVYFDGHTAALTPAEFFQAYRQQ